MAASYVHPEVLVSADWVEEHQNDPKVRIVESDEDVLLYDMGHIPAPSRSTGKATSRTSSFATTSTPRNSPRSANARGSPTTRPSSSTATSRTGGPATHSGRSSYSATRIAGS